MRVVTKHGLSVLNRRYQSVLIKCLLAGMVFLPHTANAYLNFDPKTGILKVDQNSTLDNSYSVNEIAFDASEKFVLDGKNNSLVAGNDSIKISGNGILKDIVMTGTVTGAGDNTATVAGYVTFNTAVSNINLNIGDGANLIMNGTMQGGALTGSASLSNVSNGIFDNVDVSKFLGTTWDAHFKNSNTFSLGNKDAGSSMKYGNNVYIYAKQITGYYHGYYNPNNAANEFNSGYNLYLKNYENTAAGTWLLNNETVSLKGGKIEGNLNGGSLRLFDENSRFSGELTNVKIYIENADYTWNDNIQIASTSSGNQFYIGDLSGSEQRVFNMNADLTLDETSVVFTRYATVKGNNKTITTRFLHVTENSQFNNVTIKFDDNLDVTGGGTPNLVNSTLWAGESLATGNLNTTNSTLHARKQITAGDINVTGTLTVDMINASTFSANSITGADGATVRFQSSQVNLNSTDTLKISNVLLDFANTDAFVGSAVFTNTRMQTKLVDDSSIRFGDASFNGNNTITANGISAVGSLTVSNGGSLTVKNLDGTGNGLLNGNLNLYGHFTGDMQGDIKVSTNHDWSFNGKFNGNIEAVFKDSVLDTTSLKLAQDSAIGSLTLERSYDSKSADVIVNSDLAVSNLIFNNKREQSSSDPENAGKITGTGTLKVDKVTVNRVANVVSENQNVYFDGISIAALNDNLVFDGASSSRYDFTNNAISAGNNIVFSQNATFNGNSSLTAYHIKAEDDLVINGTLTLNGSLEANNITGGTLNVILPSAGAEGKLVSAKTVDNVKLTLNLKNVNNKEKTQRYYLTDNSSFTLSGSYGKYAFSDESFTLEEWKANKSYYQLSEAWDRIKMGMDAINKPGYLWILKVAGGAESAINDLRMAGIYVSPTEENASKILDLINDNPFADRLTDLLDSGDAGLQKQALREIAPTDAASSAFKTAKSAASAVMNAVSGRLGGASDVSGRSGGDLTAGESAAWAQGLFNRAKMTGGDGFTSGTAGFSAGVETNLTDEIKAGFGYAFASTDIKTDRSKTDADTHTGFVYGEYAPDALYVNAMLGYGRSDYDDKAKLSGMKNSYKADTFSARVAAGYDMGILTPEAALRFTAVRQNAYTDELGARVSAKNLNTTTAVVGAKAGKDFAAGKYTVSPEMKAALTYDLARPNESRMVALPDGSSYVAAGEHLNRLGVEVGAKAAVRLTNEIELSLSYDGAFKEHYQDHTGLINVKVDF